MKYVKQKWTLKTENIVKEILKKRIIEKVRDEGVKRYG